MFFQEIAEAVLLHPGKSGRRIVDIKIHRHIGNFRLDWKESSDGKLKFIDDDGREVVVTSTWKAPDIEAYAQDDPETYKEIFKSVIKEPL